MNPIPNRSMKPNNIKVAARLKAIQEASGLSLSDMAKLLEIPKGTLSSYIRGLTLPPRPLAEKIISYFFKGDKVEWFYYGDIVDYIRDYLNYKGHQKFLDSYPYVPDHVYLMCDVDNCGPNPTDEDIDVSFGKLCRENKLVNT